MRQENGPCTIATSLQQTVGARFLPLKKGAQEGLSNGALLTVISNWDDPFQREARRLQLLLRRRMGPGGLPGLQNRVDGRKVVGGFDSLPPPPCVQGFFRE